MRKVLFILLSLLVSTAALAAEPQDFQATAKTLVQDVGAAAWNVAQQHAVPLSNPTAQRVMAVFQRLEQGDALKGVELVVTDLGTNDPEAAAMGSNRILVRYDFARRMSDDALAFAIGHELGHLRLHHLEGRVTTYLLAASRQAPETSTAVVIAAATAAMDTEVQRQELEADAFGVELATRAGFDAKRGLQESVGDTDADSTHPSGSVRVLAQAQH